MSRRSGNVRGVLLLLAAASLASGCSRMGARTPTSDAAETGAEPGAQGQGLAADAAVREVPATAAPLWARAQTAMREGDRFEAEVALQQLIREHPGLVGPFVNLAILYRQMERETEARALLDEALAINPNHPAANNELGMMLRERGEFAAAEAAYRNALAGDPSYAYAHFNLGVLLDVYLQRRAEAVEHYEIYQSLLDEPDQQVDFWIADLRRRIGPEDEPERIAQEDGR